MVAIGAHDTRFDGRRHGTLRTGSRTRPGAAILPFFRADGGLHADSKDGAGFDPVTEGDRAAERAMRDILARERPEDGILGEEFGHVPGTSGREWVLDPIDGTRGFLSGTPTWGVLIAADRGRRARARRDRPALYAGTLFGRGRVWPT